MSARRDEPRPGDVWKGTDPADRRAWAYLPDSPDDPLPWVLLGPDTPWTHRRDLPERLRLTVRDGQAVQP